MNKAINNHGLSTINSLLPETRTLQKEGERFLKFSLKKSVNGLILLRNLKGTIEVALTDILPVPQVAKYWLGIINYQGEAVWILDFGQLLNAPHWTQKVPAVSSGMAILISIENITVGLLIDRIYGIENYDGKSCLPISEIDANKKIKSLFRGYFLDNKGEPSMLLDIDSLFYFLQD